MSLWLVIFALQCVAKPGMGSWVDLRRIDIDPSILSRKIQDLTENSLKHKEMQSHLDTMIFTDQPLDGDILFNSLVSIFAKKFQEKISVVKRLRDVVVTSYAGTTSPSTKCCEFPTSSLQYDPQYKTSIARQQVCEQISPSSPHNSARLTSAFKDVCVENRLGLPSLKWQYFGSEQGVTTKSPAVRSNSCDNYDNRYRPWYVQANVPQSKEVVIVIDKSGSMAGQHDSGTLFSLARDAAKTVIATLNPYDKFAAFAFSDTVQVMSNKNKNDRCFSNSLAQATPQNKRKVSSFIDSLSPKGGTTYGKALNKAFDYLQGGNEQNSDRVILFMSDGQPNDAEIDILHTLRFRNAELTNSVVLMTYGIGHLDFSILKNMSEQKGSTQDGVKDVTRGKFIKITDPDKLRNQMASYYNFFAAASRGIQEPIWTAPYLDAWGLGMMITASLPVYKNSDLIGVAAVDVTIEELLAESTYFRPNELSYSFVIDSTGLVINHPLFPYVTDRDSFFVSATAYERDPEFLTVFESMKSGYSGNKTFVSTRIVAQGDSRKYGVKQLSVLSTYYWKRIPGTKFSICLVLATNDTQSILATQSTLGPNSFLYHRLDLIPPQTACRHINSYSAMNQSAVFLASRAFSDPEYYLSREFTASDVEDIVSFMEGNGSNTQNIKVGIRDEVFGTQYAEVLWTAEDRHTDLQRQVVWRYVGTKNGLYRIYPGTQMPKDYDPILRPWYEHALANRNSNVITPPYSDAASGAPVITFSRVLFEGRPKGVHDILTDEVVAVMGVDVLLSYFHKILHELYPICNDMYRCLVIDKAGFVIVADQFNTSQSTELSKHVTQFEPEVSNVLIRENILQPVSCSNIESALLQRMYKVKDGVKAYSGATHSCYHFQLALVAHTNAYLLIRTTQKQNDGCIHPYGTTCTCNVNQTCTGGWTGNFCECPCSAANDHYFPCDNKYTFASKSPPPCTPENVELSSVTQSKVNLKTLPKCYDVDYTYLPKSGSKPLFSPSLFNFLALVLCMTSRL